MCGKNFFGNPLLLYLAQGYYLARYWKLLFDEDFVAYEFAEDEMRDGPDASVK